MPLAILALHLGDYTPSSSISGSHHQYHCLLPEKHNLVPQVDSTSTASALSFPLDAIVVFTRSTSTFSSHASVIVVVTHLLSIQILALSASSWNAVIASMISCEGTIGFHCDLLMYFFQDPVT